MTRNPPDEQPTMLGQRRDEIRQRIAEFLAREHEYYTTYDDRYNLFELSYPSPCGEIQIVLSIEAGEEFFLIARAILPVEFDPESWSAVTEHAERINEKLSFGEFVVWPGNWVEFEDDAVVVTCQTEAIVSRLLAGAIVTVKLMLPSFRCVAYGCRRPDDVIAGLRPFFPDGWSGCGPG